MHQERPARVVWLYDRRDEAMARDLRRLTRVLERQQLLESWSEEDIPLGANRQNEIEEHLAAADILLVLVSPDLLANDERWLQHALERAGLGQARLIPVLLRPAILPPQLAALQALPRDGRPVSRWSNRDEAFLDVIEGLQTVIAYRSPSQITQIGEMVQEPPGAVTGEKMPSYMTINDIFRLDGPPTVTFVEPPDFPTLKLELRTLGTGMIVEGPSKVGKSTAVKKALEILGIPEREQLWWLGQAPPPISEIRATLDTMLATGRPKYLFIDDFHHLQDEETRRLLAFRMKALADQSQRRAKVTLIGINPLGSSLAQIMPDLAGRFRVLRLDRERNWTRSTRIAELVVLGEQAANIRFGRRDEFILAAEGSFFVAQLLCNRAAVQAGVFDAQPETKVIDLGPADVVPAIADEQAARFREPLLAFAACDEAPPPPRGASLSLLWLLSQNSDGQVSIREAMLRFPDLSNAFAWLLESNLSTSMEKVPALSGLLFYNRATGMLTMEDPQLRFYLRSVDWEEFARASGHGRVEFDREDGPIWRKPSRGAPHDSGIRRSPASDPAQHRDGTDGPEGTNRTDASTLQMLHLSDLHFGTLDDATLFYAQLAADLRQQGCAKLDALIVTGDVANRATLEEYDAARHFVEQLLAGFSLSPQNVVLVPGNHDVSWPLSDDAFTLHKRSIYRGELVPGTYVEHGSNIVEVRNEAAYLERFRPFAEFYRQIKGETYPLEPSEQTQICEPPGTDICLLGLNSAWEIDHHYKDRTSIHIGALSRALLRLGSRSDGCLRIAVFHHPLSSREDSFIRDTSFLQQLAVHGFSLVLHGHIHRTDSALYRYDMNPAGRRLEILSAGTFGAPTRDWVPGYPLQYNLLRLKGRRLTVETRCRRELNGAWEPDARWRQGTNQDPLPRYVIEL